MGGLVLLSEVLDDAEPEAVGLAVEGFDADGLGGVVDGDVVGDEVEELPAGSLGAAAVDGVLEEPLSGAADAVVGTAATSTPVARTTTPVDRRLSSRAGEEASDVFLWFREEMVLLRP